MSRHRRARPRYGRMAVASVSATVTAVAVLGGVGVLPSSAQGQGTSRAAPAQPEAVPAIRTEGYPLPTPVPTPLPTPPPTLGPDSGTIGAEPSAPGADEGAAEVADEDATAAQALPEDSGEGRRVVFSESRQRVWLVPGGSRAAHSYLVSGSATDNLQPGTYQVYSRSEQAWGVDDSGTMRYFVRFTRGESAAIGFHDIPIGPDGEPLQTVEQLGTPLSHGCIRQRRADARRLWRFAPLGTTVVVTA